MSSENSNIRQPKAAHYRNVLVECRVTYTFLHILRQKKLHFSTHIRIKNHTFLHIQTIDFTFFYTYFRKKRGGKTIKQAKDHQTGKCPNNKQNSFKHSKSGPYKNAELAKKIKIGPFIGHTNLMGRQKKLFLRIQLQKLGYICIYTINTLGKL